MGINDTASKFWLGRYALGTHLRIIGILDIPATCCCVYSYSGTPQVPHRKAAYSDLRCYHLFCFLGPRSAMTRRQYGVQNRRCFWVALACELSPWPCDRQLLQGVLGHNAANDAGCGPVQHLVQVLEAPFQLQHARNLWKIGLRNACLWHCSEEHRIL